MFLCIFQGLKGNRDILMHASYTVKTVAVLTSFLFISKQMFHIKNSGKEKRCSDFPPRKAGSVLNPNPAPGSPSQRDGSAPGSRPYPNPQQTCCRVFESSIQQLGKEKIFLDKFNPFALCPDILMSWGFSLWVFFFSFFLFFFFSHKVQSGGFPPTHSLSAQDRQRSAPALRFLSSLVS